MNIGNSDSTVMDNVTCCYCDFLGLVYKGGDICPQCDHEMLKWTCEENPEVLVDNPVHEMEKQIESFKK